MTTQPAVQADQAPTVKMLLDGEFIDSQTNEWHDVVNPATQQVLAQVPFATDAEINTAIASAKQAYTTWRKTPIAARARIMLKFQALIREHSKRIAAVLTAEQGKTLPDAEGDIFRGLEVVEHACSIGSLQLGEFARRVQARHGQMIARWPQVLPDGQDVAAHGGQIAEYIKQFMRLFAQPHHHARLRQPSWP